MRYAVSMMYFRSSGDLTTGQKALVAARKAMLAADLAVRRLNGPLGIHLGVRRDDDPDDPELRVVYTRARLVREEAAGSGAHSPYAAEMAECDARFEILIYDVDEVLADPDTLMEVQWALADLARCFIVNSWNGNVSGPDE